MAIRRRSMRTRRRGGTARKRSGRRLKGVTSVAYRRKYVGAAAAGLAFVGRARNAKRAAVGVYRGNRQRRRPIGDPGGYTQWSTYQASKKLGKYTQRKINYKDQKRMVLCWRNVARLVSQGNLYMNHFYDTTTSQIGWPMYLFDLTSYEGAYPCVVPTRTASGISWTYQSHSLPSGVSGTLWGVERQEGTLTARVPKAILKWAEARMDLWGAKTQPTKYYISLVQFDEDYVPVGNVTSAPVVNWWDAVAKRLTYNPSVKDPSYANKRVCKTLWKREFLINPTETSESDPDPHCRTVKFFWNMNRRANFGYKFNDNAVTALADVETTKFDNVLPADIGVEVHPKARVYLWVSACKFYQDANYAAQTATQTPSVNMQIRTCWDTTAG